MCTVLPPQRARWVAQRTSSLLVLRACSVFRARAAPKPIRVRGPAPRRYRRGMARARLPRRSTRRTGAIAAVAVAVVAIGAFAGVTANHRDPVPGSPSTGALRVVRVALPDAATLPPVVVDRVVEAVADRSGPRSAGPDLVLLGAVAALLVAAAGASAPDHRRRRAIGLRAGPGSTRAPPVTR